MCEHALHAKSRKGEDLLRFRSGGFFRTANRYTEPSESRIKLDLPAKHDARRKGRVGEKARLRGGGKCGFDAKLARGRDLIRFDRVHHKDLPADPAASQQLCFFKKSHGKAPAARFFKLKSYLKRAEPVCVGLYRCDDVCTLVKLFAQFKVIAAQRVKIDLHIYAFVSYSLYHLFSPYRSIRVAIHVPCIASSCVRDPSLASQYEASQHNIQHFSCQPKVYNRRFCIFCYKKILFML